MVILVGGSRELNGLTEWYWAKVDVTNLLLETNPFKLKVIPPATDIFEITGRHINIMKISYDKEQISAFPKILKRRKFPFWKCF
jgi:hypothetical protein